MGLTVVPGPADILTAKYRVGGGANSNYGPPGTLVDPVDVTDFSADVLFTHVAELLVTDVTVDVLYH